MNRTLYACAAEACAFTHNKWAYGARWNEIVQHIIIIKMNNMDFVWAPKGTTMEFMVAGKRNKKSFTFSAPRYPSSSRF